MITEEDIKEIYGIDIGEMSGGCHDIMAYCNLEEKSLPNWFVIQFLDLPRHDRRPDEDWITVRVYGMYNRYGTSPKAGEMFSWVIENLEDSWFGSSYKSVSFKNRKDAFRFKMVWG